MKKLAAVGAIFAFLCRDEVVTMLILAIIGIVLAIVLLDAWVKSDHKSLDGSFSADWGTQGKKRRKR